MVIRHSRGIVHKHRAAPRLASLGRAAPRCSLALPRHLVPIFYLKRIDVASLDNNAYFMIDVLQNENNTYWRTAANLNIAGSEGRLLDFVNATLTSANKSLN